MPSKRWIIHSRPRRRSDEPQVGSDTATPDPDPVQLHAKSPAIYHCVNRVVDRRYVFGNRERDKFIEMMRMYEAFAGIRILAHCVMSNHFHLMIEVIPMPEGGLRDAELLNRLSAIYDESQVELVEIELERARIAIAEGRATARRAEEIHERYTYRMHDLSEFMKSLVQRFTQWYNRRNSRKGNLWEDAFRSVVVEPGTATRLVAAYIDLNPVRAGMVEDPADYPWCSYGEATGGANSGKKPTRVNLRARAALVRAFETHLRIPPDAGRWKSWHDIYRTWIDEAMASVRATKAGSPPPKDADTPGVALTCRIRHFTEGLAIGGRDYLECFFQEKRDRFGSKRTSGSRPIRGPASKMAQREGICCLRDLQKNIEP